MRLVSKIKKVVSGTFVIGIFALALFSPLVPFHQIQTAQAKVCPPQNEALGAPVTVPDDQPCPNGTGDTTVGDSSIGSSLGYYVAQIVYVFTVGLGSAVTYVAANILNFAVHISLDSAAYGLQFISEGWTMMRDIANMAFIFILIYIAMKVMFEAHTAGTVGLLAKVLAVALVINFSFFATRVVIDAGNLISVQFYNAIVAEAPDAAVQLVAGVATPAGGVPDITKKIMAGVNFQTAIGPESFKNVTQGSIDDGFGETFIAYSFIYIVMGAMLFMLAAAFIAAGVKFIIRIVMLWMSIITAPLALVAWSFQGGGGHGGGHGGGYFSKWSKGLISHAFYPAVFLFVMLLISNFMGNTDFGAGYINEAIRANQVSGSTGGLQSLGVLLANIAVRLGFVIVMLYFALKASDYFEVAGASFAKTWGSNLAYGAPGWLMRGTLGRGANYLNTKFNTNEAGVTKSKVAAALLNIPAKQSFNARDLRQTLKPVGEALDKRLGSAAGKGGWAEFAHDRSAAKERAEKGAVSELEHNIDHHMGGPKEEAEAQAAFRKGYEGGASAFDARVAQLTTEIKDFKTKSIDAAKKQAKATDKATRDEAARDFKKAQDDMRASESQLKILTGMGKRVVENQNKEHSQEIAIKLMSSGDKVQYIVAQKMLSKDSKEKKAAKALQELAKGEGEEGGGEEKGGAAGHAAPSGGAAHTPAAPVDGHGPIVPPSVH